MFTFSTPPSVTKAMGSLFLCFKYACSKLFLLRRFVPHLHMSSTLRSSGLLQTQYRFIPFRSAYAPLHTSSIISVASGCYSGCAFAQPSELTPFLEKRHFAINQGTPKTVLYFSPAVSRSQYFYPLPRGDGYVLFPSRGGCPIAVSIRTPPKRK